RDLRPRRVEPPLHRARTLHRARALPRVPGARRQGVPERHGVERPGARPRAPGLDDRRHRRAGRDGGGAGGRPPAGRAPAARAGVIVTRRRWRILAERTCRPVVLARGLLGFLALRAMAPPAGLSAAAQSALAIFALCLVYWVTNVIPLMVTSLLAMVLLPTTGVLSAKDTYALFGNEAVFFILGAFILAASLMKCGLSTRIAIAVLRRFGHTPRTLLLSLF